MTRIIIIVSNILVSSTLTTLGLRGMVLRDALLGTGYEWSTLMWILGLISFFLIPLEICLIKPQKRE